MATSFSTAHRSGRGPLSFDSVMAVLGGVFEILMILIYVAAVTTDAIVCYQFGKHGEWVWFGLVMAPLVISSFVNTLAAIIHEWFKRLFPQSTALRFIVVLPIANFMPLLSGIANISAARNDRRDTLDLERRRMWSALDIVRGNRQLATEMMMETKGQSQPNFEPESVELCRQLDCTAHQKKGVVGAARALAYRPLYLDEDPLGRNASILPSSQWIPPAVEKTMRPASFYSSSENDVSFSGVRCRSADAPELRRIFVEDGQTDGNFVNAIVGSSPGHPTTPWLEGVRPSTGAGVEAIREVSTSFQIMGRLNTAISQSTEAHIFFFIESLSNSLPQLIIQVLAFTFLQLSSGSSAGGEEREISSIYTIQVVSIVTSLFSILSKGYYIAGSATLSTLIWKVFCFSADLFGLIYIFSSLTDRSQAAEVPLLWFITASGRVSWLTNMFVLKWCVYIVLALIIAIMIGISLLNEKLRQRPFPCKHVVKNFVATVSVGLIAMGPSAVIFEGLKIAWGVAVVKQLEGRREQHGQSALLYTYLACFNREERTKRIRHFLKFFSNTSLRIKGLLVRRRGIDAASPPIQMRYARGSSPNISRHYVEQLLVNHLCETTSEEEPSDWEFPSDVEDGDGDDDEKKTTAPAEVVGGRVKDSYHDAVMKARTKTAARIERLLPCVNGITESQREAFMAKDGSRRKLREFLNFTTHVPTVSIGFQGDAAAVTRELHTAGARQFSYLLTSPFYIIPAGTDYDVYKSLYIGGSSERRARIALRSRMRRGGFYAATEKEEEEEEKGEKANEGRLKYAFRTHAHAARVDNGDVRSRELPVLGAQEGNVNSNTEHASAQHSTPLNDARGDFSDDGCDAPQNERCGINSQSQEKKGRRKRVTLWDHRLPFNLDSIEAVFDVSRMLIADDEKGDALKKDAERGQLLLHRRPRPITVRDRVEGGPLLKVLKFVFRPIIKLFRTTFEKGILWYPLPFFVLFVGVSVVSGQLFSVAFPFVSFFRNYDAQNLLQSVCLAAYVFSIIVVLVTLPFVIRAVTFHLAISPLVSNLASSWDVFPMTIKRIFCAIERRHIPPVHALVNEAVGGNAFSHGNDDEIIDAFTPLPTSADRSPHSAPPRPLIASDLLSTVSSYMTSADFDLMTTGKKELTRIRELGRL